MKTKINFKNIEIVGAIWGISFGTILHFLYAWSGNQPWVGLFSAVNESPWEHLKLFFFPMIIFLAVEWLFVTDKNRLLLAKVLETFFGLTFILTFFYTYTGALGIESVIVDIASFYLAVIVGKAISYKVISTKFDWQGYAWLHATVLVLVAILFFVATFIPPHIPLFKDSPTGNYGIVK